MKRTMLDIYDLATWPKHLVVLLSICFLGIGYVLVYWFAIRSVEDERIALSTSILEQQNMYAQMYAKVPLLSNGSRGKETLTTVGNGSPQVEVSGLLEDIDSMVGSLGVMVEKVQIRIPVEQGSYEVTPIFIEARGEFVSLVSFLQLLQELGPGVVITGAELKRADERNSQEIVLLLRFSVYKRLSRNGGG